MTKEINIIGWGKVFLSVSGFLVLLSVAAVLLFGVKPGIDLAGGALWQVKFQDQGVNAEAVKSFFEKKAILPDAVVVGESSTGSFIVRTGEISEQKHFEYFNLLKTAFGEFEELRFEAIGPAIGGELRRRALWAAFLVLFGISVYVAWAFRKVSRPVGSFKYGLIALVTLFHDVVIPVGLFAFLGKFYGAEVDTNFIIALLVVMGFSVHDTIVVFDRIRENLSFSRDGKDFLAIVNRSVNETLARSVNTSLTLVFVLVALYFLGPASMNYFILTILVGTTVGTYSSIFVASPLLAAISKK